TRGQRGEIGKIIREALDAVPPSYEVQAAKLGQISRAGLGRWRQYFAELVSAAFAWGEVPVFVANSTIYGFRAALESAPHEARCLIVDPKRIVGGDEHWCIEVEKAGGDVRVAASNERSPVWRKEAEFVLIDDVVKTGRVLGQVMEGLKGRLGSMPVTKAYCLDDCRGVKGPLG